MSTIKKKYDEVCDRNDKRNDNSDDDSSKKYYESVTDSEPTAPSLTGFDLGLEVEEIIGVAKIGELYHLIKFKGVENPSIVPAESAHIKIPQILLRFYEERMI